MPSRNHKHVFTALWWHFGQYGPQDVHIHSCIVENKADDDGYPRCDRVLIGLGRTCTPGQKHERATLGDGKSIVRAAAKLKSATNVTSGRP